jgi:hypothetical protein
MDDASDDYKPKFRDMRIRPPKAGEKEAERDVHALKPGEVRCEWPGCAKAATARAPKSRDMPGEYYRFCTPHAGEYNKRWDFFSGMSEGEAARRMNEERMTGGRPTWAFRASNKSREASAKLAGKYQDPLGVFGVDGATTTAPGRSLGKIESRALADMDLDVSATKEEIRAKYTELLKRLHPDSNGGDRSMEDKLQRVIRAYKALKAAKLV